MVRTKQMWCAAVVGALVVASAHVSVVADQVVLSPVNDNTLIERKAGDRSNGLGDVIHSGRTGNFGEAEGNRLRAVIRFDPSASVPAGSTITNVRLTLTMMQAGPGSGTRTHSLHRMSVDWGEGASSGNGGLGSPAASGDATWLHTFFPDQLWSSPGGDFDSSVVASQDVGESFGEYHWDSETMIVDVQNWLDNPSTNFGWVLIGDESVLRTARKFASRENATVEFRPVLEIDFKSPSDCPADCADPPDDQVDMTDLMALINRWGTKGGGGPCDIAPPDGNGTVNVDDLLAIINAWGPCP